MRYTAKEFITFTFLAILAYLALVHSTGLAQDISALGKAYESGVQKLQGR